MPAGLRVNLWISFSISIVFLLGLGVNFKPLLKTPTCVPVRYLLDKVTTLGLIIVCLFDWCELHPVCETKNYLRLRHLIVNLYLPLDCQLLLQFDFVVFLLFLRSWLVQLRSHQILNFFFFVVVVWKDSWISQIYACFSCRCIDFLIPLE